MATIIKKIKEDPLDKIGELSIKELEEVIEYASDKYYNTNKPVIEDAYYDLMIDYL